jgi:hypothetical protein
MKMNINISGIILHTKKDGYHKLKEYLETTKKSTASYNRRFEIMSYMENRIAETFLTTRRWNTGYHPGIC